MSALEPPRLTHHGRQPVLDYLTKDFEGFRQAMLSQIPILLPEWTDRGEGDFGVVLIELYAYVADILSYYQDRIANEAYLPTATQRRSVVELLRLIDYQIDPGLSATTLLHLDVSEDTVVPASALPYRVATAGVPGQTEQTFEVTEEFSLATRNNGIDLGALGLAPDALGAGTAALALPAGVHGLVEGMPVYVEERTPRPDAPPLVRRSPILRVTRVESGPATDTIRWVPPLPFAFVPDRSLLRGNNVPASHGVTVTDEPSFVGDGTPGQRMTLSRRPVSHRLSAAPTVRRRSRAELEVRVAGERWDEVANFVESRASDRHYTTSIDENDYLTVTFGDGARGSVPPAGAEVTARYRIGLGSRGNVGADRLTTPRTVVPTITAVTNPFPATGGAERETIAEARISGPGSVIAQERAVTLEDYVLLAKGFPGVGKAGAEVGLRGGYKVVQVFVAPENPETVPPPPPNAELRAALKAHLEARMPVNRMAGVDVLDPVYVPIDVSLEITLKPQAARSRVASDARAALRALLAFENRGFGEPVRVGEVYAALHRVEGIAYTLLRRLARGDRPFAPPAPGCDFADVPIGRRELAYAGAVTLSLFGGI
jgi:uncharacterized phage protein gp47/JayE